MRKAERGEERLKDIRGDACGATSAITAAALSSCIGPKLHVSRGVEREGTKKVVGVGVERKFPVGTSLPERELNGPGGGSYTFRVQKHIGVGLTTLLLGCVLPQFNRGVSYGVCTLTTLQTPFILYGTVSDKRGSEGSRPHSSATIRSLPSLHCLPARCEPSPLGCRLRSWLRLSEGIRSSARFSGELFPRILRVSIPWAHFPDGRFYRQILRGALSEARKWGIFSVQVSADQCMPVALV